MENMATSTAAVQSGKKRAYEKSTSEDPDAIALNRARKYRNTFSNQTTSTTVSLAKSLASTTTPLSKSVQSTTTPSFTTSTHSSSSLSSSSSSTATQLTAPTSLTQMAVKHELQKTAIDSFAQKSLE